MFAVLSGEEQGLYGGKVLADYARAHNWRLEADLNNDIVGNSEGANGVHDATHVRVFSEGTRAMETTEEANRRRYNGGEVDSPSRNLARFIDALADRYLDQFRRAHDLPHRPLRPRRRSGAHAGGGLSRPCG